jgi:tetratricopeptide (TPR) repeat protein
MEENSSFDPYAELQLSPDAEPELIKAAFKALAKKYHPDKFSDPVEKKRAEQKMARINEAQQLLASGNYRPPRSRPSEPSAAPPPPPPPPKRTPPPSTHPSTPPPRSRKTGSEIKIAPILVAVLVLIALTLVPGLFAKDNLKKALEYEREGRLQDSLTYLNEAVKEDPHDRELYRHRARVWEKLGEPEKAAVDLNNAQIPELTFPTPKPTPESTINQVSQPSGENSEIHVP